jgi:hypothetical protein
MLAVSLVQYHLQRVIVLLQVACPMLKVAAVSEEFVLDSKIPMNQEIVDSPVNHRLKRFGGIPMPLEFRLGHPQVHEKAGFERRAGPGTQSLAP